MRWCKFKPGQKAKNWMALNSFAIAYDRVPVIDIPILTVRPGESIPDNACCSEQWAEDFKQDGLTLLPLHQ